MAVSATVGVSVAGVVFLSPVLALVQRRKAPAPLMRARCCKRKVADSAVEATSPLVPSRRV